MTIPLAEATSPLFALDVSSHSTCEVCVDNFTRINLCEDSNNKTVNIFYNIVTNTFDLFINTCAKHLLHNLTRKIARSARKLLGEGTPSEMQTVLGWIINTRTLTITFPVTKGNRWIKDISNHIDQKTITPKELEKLIGRLVRASIIIPGSNIFLTPLRSLFYSSNGHRIHIQPNIIMCFEFLKKVITRSILGATINRIILRKP